MHVISPAPRITLARGAVRIGVFATLQEVGRHVGMATIRGLVYRQREEALETLWYTATLPSPAVLTVHDGDDVAVSWYEVLQACRDFDRRKYRGRLETWSGIGPVPGTGRRRNYRCMRRPRTTQELRLASGVVFEEGEPEWRPRRRNVPTMWDDVLLHRDHSWKRHRCTQWK